MRAYRTCFVILTLLFLSSNVFGETPLTMDDCIRLAKTDNLELVQKKAALAQAQATVMEAYSSWYPSIGLSSGYRYTDNDTGNTNYSTTVGLSYTIFKGGYIRSAVSLANAQVRNAVANYRLSENSVVFQLKDAFFQILQKEEQISLIENIISRRKEELALIALKYQAGKESSPAVKEAEANLLQAEYDKMLADNELLLAKIRVNILLNRPRTQELSVVYTDKDYDFPSREQMIEEAKRTRPEIEVEMATSEIFEAQVKQAKSGYFPTIAVSSSYGWQGTEFSDQERNWSVGATVSFPLFSGFARRAQVRRATLAFQEQQTTMQALQQTIEEEIEQNYANLQLAEKNSELRLKTLEAAREMYDLTKLQYQQGLTSYFFLQQKESALTQAEYNYINALYNRRISRAKMEMALGRSS